MTAAITLTGRCALIFIGSGQFVSFFIEQLIYGFSNAFADYFLQFTLDNFLVQLYNFSGMFFNSFRMFLFATFILSEFLEHVYFVFLRKILYLISEFACAQIPSVRLYRIYKSNTEKSGIQAPRDAALDTSGNH